MHFCKNKDKAMEFAQLKKNIKFGKIMRNKTNII